MANLKHMNNDMAVSPIVATLVLIVVAVIGAVAVGTIMGTFSSDVSKKTNAEGASTASATHILVAGSTTVQPASILLVQAYEKEHPGIQIDVQGGGSGAGISAVGQNIADIGASSSALTAANMQTYPNLQAYQIGSRAVVWIVNSACTETTITKADMATWIGTGVSGTFLQNGGVATTIDTLVQRVDASGTESTAAAWVNAAGFSGDNAFDNVAIKTKPMNGNPGVVTEINSNGGTNELGFADLGYVYDSSGNKKSTATNVKVLAPKDAVNTYPAASALVGATLRKDGLTSAKNKINAVAQGVADYPQALTSQLLYITNGAPSSVIKNFIQFAQSPDGGVQLQAAGDYSNSEM